MCGGNFFKWAFEELGHNVFSIGYFSKDVVPWEGHPKFPQYVFPPDVGLENDKPFFPLEEALKRCPFKPDLIFQVDAGFYLSGDSGDIPNAMFATDPHFLDYHLQSNTVDFFFNPQPSTLSKYPRSIFLPWAYDPNIHKVLPETEKIFDIVFIGLMYENRKKALDLLSDRYKVYAQNAGTIYDECTRIYNQGKISFNWSSNDDIPMRLFEGMAYGTLVFTNRLTGLDRLFKEDKHYIGYDTIDELMEKVAYYMERPRLLDRIAEAGYLAVEKHTYHNRVLQVLREVFK